MSTFFQEGTETLRGNQELYFDPFSKSEQLFSFPQLKKVMCKYIINNKYKFWMKILHTKKYSLALKGKWKKENSCLMIFFLVFPSLWIRKPWKAKENFFLFFKDQKLFPLAFQGLCRKAGNCSEYKEVFVFSKKHHWKIIQLLIWICVIGLFM